MDNLQHCTVLPVVFTSFFCSPAIVPFSALDANGLRRLRTASAARRKPAFRNKHRGPAGVSGWALDRDHLHVPPDPHFVLNNDTGLDAVGSFAAEP